MVVFVKSVLIFLLNWVCNGGYLDLVLFLFGTEVDFYYIIIYIYL